MSDTIIITDQDRIDAENILEQFLGDKIDADFSKGGALRDFAVTAMGYIFAYLRREIDITRARQSLLLLAKLAGAEVDDAVDEILSNWFITRKVGRYATGVITVYLSQETDVNIDITTKFFKTSSLAFVPDALETVTIAKEDLTQVIDESGVVASYAFQLSVKAALPGTDYNIEPGAFVDFNRFNPYVTRVENQNKFAGGGGTETTAEMLSRSQTAVSVRDLNSPRSIDATLKDEFTTVDDVTVIGFGDEEMIRDLVLEEATSSRIHAGGHVDAYLRGPILTDKVFTAEVGGVGTDPRPGYFILRDDTIADFTALANPPVVGDILRIHNAEEPSEAAMYIIKQVTPYGLYVSRRAPFPLALPTLIHDYIDGHLVFDSGQNRVYSTAYAFQTLDIGKFIRVYKGGLSANVGTGEIVDVNVPLGYAVVQGFPSNFTDETGVTFGLESRVVEYTVGDNSPTFNNKISTGGSPKLSGMFTKSLQNDGRILLPPWPVYRISEVSLPGTGLPIGWLDTDGRMRFTQRVNRTPVWPGAPIPGNFEYEVICNNPPEGSSGWQVLELVVVGPTGATYFNGKTLTVKFDTLSGYDSIWNMMVSQSRRIICGSVIPKGLHPIYLTMGVKYRLTKLATADIDKTAVAQALAEHINNFDTREDIDASDIMGFLRTNYSDIGFIEPVTIDYVLYAPDGRAIPYRTTDVVSIDPEKQDVLQQIPAEDNLAYPLSIGVSDNTVRYLTVASLITLTNLEA
jgi:hypothetical protein